MNNKVSMPERPAHMQELYDEANAGDWFCKPWPKVKEPPKKLHTKNRDNTPANKIGLRLRKIRKSLGLTQKQISQRTGIRQSDISRYENAEYSLPASSLAALSKIGVNLDWLINGQGPMLRVESNPMAKKVQASGRKV